MGKNRLQGNSAQWRQDAKVELDEEADELERQRLWYEGEDDEDYPKEIVEPQSSTDEGSCYEPDEEYDEGRGAYIDDFEMADEPFTKREKEQMEGHLHNKLLMQSLNRDRTTKS